MKKPQSLSDADLGKLYTATSLMQIDDNVMRYEGQFSAPLQNSKCLLVPVLFLHAPCWACRSLLKYSEHNFKFLLASTLRKT